MKKLMIILIVFALAGCYSDSSPSPTRNMSTNEGFSGDGIGSPITGVAGSMARMNITGDHLYIVTENTLYSFSLADPTSPELESEIGLNRFVETIFSYDGQLFLGTRTGLLIYNLNNPDRPSYVSEFNHIFSCDPVVVSGDRAYLTLSSATDCNRGVNRLDVLDISNLNDPRLLQNVNMENPKGLGIYGDDLYVCDNNNLLHFRLSNGSLNGVSNTYNLPGAYDVIPYNGILIAVASDGIYQFEMLQDGALDQLSKIETE